MDRSASPLLLTTALLAVLALRQMQPGAAGEWGAAAWSPAQAQREVEAFEAAVSRTLEAVGQAQMLSACAGEPELTAGFPPPFSLPKSAYVCGSRS